MDLEEDIRIQFLEGIISAAELGGGKEYAKAELMKRLKSEQFDIDLEFAKLREERSPNKRTKIIYRIREKRKFKCACIRLLKRYGVYLTEEEKETIPEKKEENYIGNVFMYAKCSHCDFEEDYNPAISYIYEYEDFKTITPIIRSVWCNDCKNFVPAVMGQFVPDAEKVYAQLISLEKRLFKTNNVKQKIDHLKNELRDLVVFKSIYGHKSDRGCIECGGNNLVFKDIETQIWSCPKCGIGVLMLKKVDSGVIFRRSTRYITPIKQLDYDLFHNVFLCALDMKKNEEIFCMTNEKYETVNNISTFIALVDRVALIYVCLCKRVKHISMGNFIFHITNEFVEGDVFKVGKKFIHDRLIERITYFDLEFNNQKRNSFNPVAMVKVLSNPQIPATHDCSGMGFVYALRHWEIITDTIKAYFDELLSVLDLFAPLDFDN